MFKKYHSTITTQALSEYFSPQALVAVISANLGQDHWLYGQIGHPEYHFDQNAFLKSWNYIERNRLDIHFALKAGNALMAQQALGRVTHVVQDFYAHTDYVRRWLDRFPQGHWPSPAEIDPVDADLLKHPDLRSGKIYWPFEPLSWIPGLDRLIIPFLPRDSHAWMNLDSPARGLMFDYAFSAAIKRTRHEYHLTITGLPPESISILCGNLNTYTRAV